MPVKKSFSVNALLRCFVRLQQSYDVTGQLARMYQIACHFRANIKVERFYNLLS